jgi:branched-subunit amino acid transport protein AzlD
MIGCLFGWGVVLFWDSGSGRDMAAGFSRVSSLNTLLFSGAMVGLVITMIVGPLMVVRSRKPPDHVRFLGMTIQFFGWLLVMGCVFSWVVLSNQAVAKEIQTADAAHVRAITLRPFAANMSPGIDLPDLFTVPMRIEDPQVISSILQELQGPIYLQTSTQFWRCRMDLDFGDHQRYCYVTSKPADNRMKGVRVLITDSSDRHASICGTRIRYPLGALLESMARNK